MVARWRLISADDPTDVAARTRGPDHLRRRPVRRGRRETGDIVRVHWVEGSDAFGKRALKIAEDAIRDDVRSCSA